MITVRSAARDDLPAVVEVMNAFDVATLGQPDSSEEDVLANWGDSTFDITKDAYVAEEGGRLVGYTEVYDRGEEGQLDIDLFCRPEAVGDAGPMLLDRAVERADEWGGDGVALASWVPEDTTTADVFFAAGFAAVRAFQRMRVTLDGPVAAPVPPAGVELRPVRRGEDERLVFEVLSDAFAHHVRPMTSYERFAEAQVDHPEYDPSLWALAFEGERALGAINVFNHEEMAFIRHVGVRAEARGRGIGSALIRRALAQLHERGQRHVDLGVDIDDEVGAARLYENLGFVPVQKLQLVQRRPAR